MRVCVYLQRKFKKFFNLIGICILYKNLNLIRCKVMAILNVINQREKVTMTIIYQKMRLPEQNGMACGIDKTIAPRKSYIYFCFLMTYSWNQKNKNKTYNTVSTRFLFSKYICPKTFGSNCTMFFTHILYVLLCTNHLSHKMIVSQFKG